MSARGASMAFPSKDRLHSNSPDPVQSSILRDSAKGWGRSSSPGGTTPLRIAKREGRPPFPLVARRSSSSYKHVTNSSLVSKSPFKTQTTAPSEPSMSTSTVASSVQKGTRRVSGEKRPRPDSMHEQAENERPLASKRERRQSEAYQGLIEKEPVTKSPFKQVIGIDDEQPPPVPPKPAFAPSVPLPVLPSPPHSAPPSRPITPSRSSLVSKRLHGPRAADQSSLDGKRQRRKTVTFDERCDVLEFDRDEEEEENPFFSSDEDDYGEPERRDELQDHHSPGQDVAIFDEDLHQSSLESPHLGDLDRNITGTTDNLIQPTSLQGLGLPSTPSHHPSLPADMETEDGVPYGRTHHAERARRRASVSSPAISSPAFPFHSSEHTVSNSPSTPPRTAESSMDISISSGAGIPLGRSTHVERARQDHQPNEVEADVNVMPPSPCPANKPLRSEHSNQDSLIPRFELQTPRDESSPKNDHISQSSDPFCISRSINQINEPSFASFDDPLDPANLSIGQSEVSLSNLDLEAELQKVLNPPQPDSADDIQRLSDFIPRSTSFSTSTPPPHTSPLFGATSVSFGTPVEEQVAQKEHSSPHIPQQSSASRAPAPSSSPRSRPVSPSEMMLPPEEHDASSMEQSIVDSTQPQLAAAACPQSSFSRLETSMDLSGGLGLGLRDSMGSIQLGEMRSALDRLMDDVQGNSESSAKGQCAGSQARIELVAEGIRAGQFSANTSSNAGDNSMQTETDMDLSMDGLRSAPIVEPTRTSPLPIQRAATEPVVYMGPSFRSPVDEAPPPFSPTKDAIRTREELILQKRREARKRDEEESMGYYTPPRPTSAPPSTDRSIRRRSRSTGDARAVTKSDLLLDIGISDTEEEFLANSISKELRKLDPEHRQGKYRVREHEAIFASADAEQVSHTSFAGDVNSGKAWKAVRRPSDMNEYAKQIKEYRSQEKPGKSHGKVFVRVLGLKSLKVPIPQQATGLTCTLNNGIHYVTTPETRLSSDARIDQEFELIEHNKLEFTLTLKIRRDPHIVAQFKALAPPPRPPPQPVALPPKPKAGMFSFLSSSPKKPVSRATPPPSVPPAPPPHKLPENLARYLKQDGTLARAFISFKDVAARCDTCLLEIKYPLIGQRSEASGGATSMELGEIVLQLFRLPSLPGVLSNQLPLSLDECLRGIRHIAWHKVTYFEGTLTQNGGDCTTWRRRTFRVTGANLIAFNDVTKKATATINLKKAIAVEDTHDARSAALGPDGHYKSDYDSLIAVERSFRLVFPSKQEILFFADSDEEKVKWLEVLRALVGRIPPNPLWAELVWQRQHEGTAHAQASD